MKNLLIFLLLALTIPTDIVAQAWEKDPSDCSWISVGCIAPQLYTGDTSETAGYWTPKKGVALFYGKDSDGTDFNEFRIALYFDRAALTYYRNSFNSWAGLEIDLLIRRNTQKTPDIYPEYIYSKPLSLVVYRDTKLGDGDDPATRGLTILNPDELVEGWNQFAFAFEDGLFDSVSPLHFDINIQLVANTGNKEFRSTMRRNNTPEWRSNWLRKWDLVSLLEIPVPREQDHPNLSDDVFKYFSVATFLPRTDNSKDDKETLRMNANMDGKGVCWNSRKKSVKAVRCDKNNYEEKLGITSPVEELPEEKNSTIHELQVVDNDHYLSVVALIDASTESETQKTSVPQICDIDVEFKIYDQFFKQVDKGAREIYQGDVLSLVADFKNEGDIDLENCRTRDSESFDVEFSAKLGTESEQAQQFSIVYDDVPNDPDEQVEISELDEGDDATAIRLFEVGESPGTNFTFRMCPDTDDNEVLMEDEECRVEELHVVEPPTYDIVLSQLDQQGFTRTGDVWTFHYQVSNIGADATPRDIGIVHISDGKVFSSTRTGPLEPGESRTLRMTGISNTPGIERKKACYQGGDFPELDDQNNCSDIGELSVRALKHSVEVHSMASGTTRQGDNWALQFTVENEFDELPADIHLLAKIDNTRLPNIVIPRSHMITGAKRTYSVSGKAPGPGSHGVQVCFQGNAAFSETNTSDNCTNWGSLNVRQLPKAPVGYMDRHNCSYFEGWAKDPNSTRSLDIHIYNDGRYYTKINANRYRGDLPYSDKRHGFRYTFPWWWRDSKTHRWDFYAIDDRVEGYVRNTRIASISKRCNNATPVGYLESNNTNCSVMQGWAKDPDTTGALSIHFYVNGGAGDVFMGSTTANRYRGDLPYSDKHHGYRFAIPSWAKTGNHIPYKAFAINKPGGTNKYLGQKYMRCR